MSLYKKMEEFKFFTTIEYDNQVELIMNKRIDEYIEIIKVYKPTIVEKIEHIRDLINQTYQKYLNGNLLEAVDCIDKIFDEYINYFYIHDLSFGNSINIYKDVNKKLFKGRTGDWTKKFDRRDMFHIPFDKRYLVESQRFSISGVPCIYLGHSAYVVWEELGRPVDDKFFISRFEISEDLKVLDLGLNYFDVFTNFLEGSSKEENFKFILDGKEFSEIFILNNVLKIVCLIKVEQLNRKFKSEYVIPQLILERGFNRGFFDGIRYPSVKVDSDTYVTCNYAFPALKNIEKPANLYSEKLIEKMSLTLPINIGMMNALTRRVIDGGSFLSENLYRDHAWLPINEEVSVIYANTAYYRIEDKLCDEKRFPLRKI